MDIDDPPFIVVFCRIITWGYKCLAWVVEEDPSFSICDRVNTTREKLFVDSSNFSSGENSIYPILVNYSFSSSSIFDLTISSPSSSIVQHIAFIGGTSKASLRGVPTIWFLLWFMCDVCWETYFFNVVKSLAKFCNNGSSLSSLEILALSFIQWFFLFPDMIRSSYTPISSS